MECNFLDALKNFEPVEGNARVGTVKMRKYFLLRNFLLFSILTKLINIISPDLFQHLKWKNGKQCLPTEL